MSDETTSSFADDIHLDTSEGPKPIVEWGQPGAPDPISTEAEPEPIAQADEPQIFDYPDGSTVSIEKTNRGWKATADSGTGKPAEVFYGNTKDELLQAVLVGKLNATRKINELKRRSVLGIGDNVPEEIPNERPAPEPQRLSADEVFDIKAKLEENPDLAMEAWFQKRTGMSLEQLLALVGKGADASDELIVEGILKEFVHDTPDYIVCHKNYEAILAWMMKYKLGRRLSSQNVATALPTLYNANVLTVENLTLAWEDLKDEGLVDVLLPEPEVERIERPTTTRPRAGFGVRTRGNTMTQRTPVEEVPTPESLESLSDDEVKKLYHGILEMNRTPAGKAAIQDAVQKVRAKRQ
jgi:hypothetical protein